MQYDAESNGFCEINSAKRALRETKVHSREEFEKRNGKVIKPGNCHEASQVNGEIPNIEFPRYYKLACTVDRFLVKAHHCAGEVCYS